jgi:hypothetical protein
MNWKRYRKLIPAVLGVTLLVVLHRWEITIPGLDMILVDWIVSAGTVFGVYQAKNEA